MFEPQQRRHRPLLLLSLAFLALALQACSMAPRALETAAPGALPATYDGQPADTLRPQPEWWTTFGDATLDRLIDTVRVRNLDLAVAAARVREVQNLYRISRAGQFPSAQFTVDGNNQSTPSNVGPTGSFGENIPGFPDRFESVTYSASLGLAYELDFWGRVRGNRAAALRDYFATAADFQTARIGALAETIATYFEIVDLERQAALTRENIDLLQERLDLTADRYQRGLVTSFELYSLQQEFDDTRASLPLLEAARYEGVGRLAILLGTVPSEADRLLGDLREATVRLEQIPAGLPSDLLQERPDVWAAAQRLEAARQRVGIARADRFPRFSLTASGGTQSSDLLDLVDVGSQSFLLFGGSLVAPVFNAGALKAAEKAAWNRYEQAAASYEKTVLTAFKETGTALNTYEKEQERYTLLQEAESSAEASAATQQDRYVRGVGDYVALLDARRNLNRARLNVATSERALANARLAVHRALGGTWVEDGGGR